MRSYIIIGLLMCPLAAPALGQSNTGSLDLWNVGGDEYITTVKGQMVANGDRAIDLADAVYLINYIFKDGPAPACP